jgi:hypothetical protein
MQRFADILAEECYRTWRTVQYHETVELGAVLDELDLPLKLAAREMIFTFLEKSKGEGWWGKDSNRDHYAEHLQETDPFH